MTDSTLKLRKFDMRWIKDDKVCVFIGRRETGKSFLLKDCLYYHRDIPAGKIICATEGANGSYGKHIPKIFISEEFNSKIISNFIKGQKKLIKLKTSDSKYKNIDERAFIVLDDCLYDTSWPKDKGIRALFMNGRHYKIFFLITMQFALGIPPVLRTNIDYVFLLRDSYKSNRKKYYEHYAGMFESFEQFCQVMDACTENYECLVIHNNSKSNKIEDMVFYYKAEEHGDFKMMKNNNSAWEFNDEMYNTEYDSDDDTKQHSKLKLTKMR